MNDLVDVASGVIRALNPFVEDAALGPRASACRERLGVTGGQLSKLDGVLAVLVPDSAGAALRRVAEALAQAARRLEPALLGPGPERLERLEGALPGLDPPVGEARRAMLALLADLVPRLQAAPGDDDWKGTIESAVELRAALDQLEGGAGKR